MSRNRFLYSTLAFLGTWMQLLAASDEPVVGIRVIDETAIPYTAFLSKAEFDQRFPGQIKSDPAELDSGWYVIYEHENLGYYFGPVALESVGRDYLARLTQTVEAAVEQRPDIEGYRLELRFEPSEGLSEGEGAGAGDGYSSGETVEPQPTQPEPTGFWGFVRRVFGF